MRGAAPSTGLSSGGMGIFVAQATTFRLATGWLRGSIQRGISWDALLNHGAHGRHRSRAARADVRTGAIGSTCGTAKTAKTAKLQRTWRLQPQEISSPHLRCGCGLCGHLCNPNSRDLDGKHDEAGSAERATALGGCAPFFELNCVAPVSPQVLVVPCSSISIATTTSCAHAKKRRSAMHLHCRGPTIARQENQFLATTCPAEPQQPCAQQLHASCTFLHILRPEIKTPKMAEVGSPATKSETVLGDGDIFMKAQTRLQCGRAWKHGIQTLAAGWQDTAPLSIALCRNKAA